MSERLEDIRRDREKQRRHDSVEQKIYISEVQYTGDQVRMLETTITLPLTREDGTRPSQTLFKAGDAEISLQTALNNVDQLTLFLERHYWAVQQIKVSLRFEGIWASNAVLRNLWKCMKMFVSLVMSRDRISCSFSVKCLGMDSNVLGGERLSVLEMGLGSWVRHIYEELFPLPAL